MGVYPIYRQSANLRQKNIGNDTIDRYPLFDGEIQQVLCVKDTIFKIIKKDFQGFSNVNKPPEIKPSQKKVKTKVKPSKKTFVQKSSSFEPTNAINALKNSRNHQIGRIKDWYGLYGQGMYD
jgi:hypothetical protein